MRSPRLVCSGMAVMLVQAFVTAASAAPGERVLRASTVDELITDMQIASSAHGPTHIHGFYRKRVR